MLQEQEALPGPWYSYFGGRAISHTHYSGCKGAFGHGHHSCEPQTGIPENTLSFVNYKAITLCYGRKTLLLWQFYPPFPCSGKEITQAAEADRPQVQRHPEGPTQEVSCLKRSHPLLTEISTGPSLLEPYFGIAS